VIGSQAKEQLGYGLAAGEDINGDGHADYAFTRTMGWPALGDSGIYLVSGLDDDLIAEHGFAQPYRNLGRALEFGDDFNADGTIDLVAGYDDGLLLLSGVDGTIIREVPAPIDADGFGHSVAMVADRDGDGMREILVGAPDARRASGQQWGGVLLISSGTGAELMRASTGEGFPDLGEVVLETDDYDGDGLADWLVTGRGHEVSRIGEAGAVFVLSSADGSEFLRYEGEHVDGTMGRALTLLSDMDGDGIREFAVSGGWTSSNHYVEIWSTQSGAPMQTLYPSTFDYQNFGESLSTLPDLDGDGFLDFSVSAPEALLFGDSSRTGSVRLLSSASGELIQELIGEAEDYLGQNFEALVIHGELSLLAGNGEQWGLADRGAVRRYEVSPCLTLDQTLVSVAAGGALTLELDFPPFARDLEYRVLFSERGTGPVKAGVWIPLSNDALFARSVAGTVHGYLQNDMVGILGKQGDRSVVVDFAPNVAPGLVGRTIYLAAVAGLPGQDPLYSSKASSILFTP